MTEAIGKPNQGIPKELPAEERYINYLERMAGTETHFKNMRKHFTKGLEYWKRISPNPDIYYFYEDDAERTIQLMCQEGYSNKYSHVCVQELKHYCNFILSEEGADFRYPAREGLWKGRFSRERCVFESDLPGYEEYLRKKGLRESTIVAKRDAARNAIVMATELSDIHCPGDIDCETVVRVGKFLKNVTDKQRNLILCCLGDFVEYKTGYNPVKELRKNSWSLDFKPKTPQELSFLRDLDEFIADLRERGFRERSLQKRAMSTAIPYRFITEMYGPVYLQNIDYHMFREAAHSMTHLKQITIQGYLGLLGQLIEFCYGYNPNLQAGIVYSKQPVDRIFIDEGQWRKILAHATLTEKMILALAAGMGLRRMEIAYIHLSDIENGQLTIYGKGTGSYGKVTKMEIPDYVQEVMDHYMVYRRTLINPIRDMSEGRLLLNDKHCIGTPMDEYVVSHLVTALGDRAGVKVSCHVFRRLYCMTMFESGIEDDTIRRMMRHSYFSTTSDHYLSADPKRLTKARKSVGGLFA